MNKPNFLLIMTDQHRVDHLGCYGNNIVRTPNIDSIARRGTRFTNFFVNCPICMPNRIAMMTGRMPTTNGSRHNGIPLDTAAVTYVDLLRHAGYRTALIGKSHLQDMTNMEAVNDKTPAESQLTPPPEPLSDATRQRRTGPEYEAEIIPFWIANPDRDVKTPYYGFDHVRFSNGHADNVHGHYDKWVSDQGVDLSAIAGRQNALPGDAVVAPQAWRTAVPEELYSTSYIEQEVSGYLRDHAEKGGDEPFFIQCSFPDPHHPFTPPGHYFDMYDPDQMPLPATFDQVGENEHPFIQELRERAHAGTSVDQSHAPFAVTDARAMREMLALTYGMITNIDDAVGRILQQLDTLGLRENTVIIFTSDHGDWMGDHGLMLKHGAHYNGVLQVPFIWSDTQPIATDEQDTLSSAIDLGPTILARAGLAPANGVQGFNLFGDPEVTGRNKRRGIIVEEDQLSGHLAHTSGLRTRSFIDGKWRLTLYDGWESGELFDREADPLELRNLWDDPGSVSDRSRLIEEMLRETIRLGDTAPFAVRLA